MWWRDGFKLTVALLESTREAQKSRDCLSYQCFILSQMDFTFCRRNKRNLIVYFRFPKRSSNWELPLLLLRLRHLRRLRNRDLVWSWLFVIWGRISVREIVSESRCVFRWAVQFSSNSCRRCVFLYRNGWYPIETWDALLWSICRWICCLSYGNPTFLNSRSINIIFNNFYTLRCYWSL